MWHTWLTKDIFTTISRLILQHLTNCLAKLYSHLLIIQWDLCTQQVIAKIIEDEPGFENHILEFEKIYSPVENEEIDLDTLSNTSCITETAKH